MAIPWPPPLNDLTALLADLYTENRARNIVRRIDLNPAFIAFDGAAINVWLRVVEEANRRGKVGDLIAVAKQDYPNIDWDVLKEQLDRSMTPAVPTRSWNWKASPLSAADWEAITGAQHTFLPISFLEVGLLRARSVAWIRSPAGVGTGFLTGDDLLITNHHVIPTDEYAIRTTVRFNYQKTASGANAEPVEYKLDPAVAFAADAVDDWTAVHVKGSPSALWGRLDLVDATVEVDDYVNIIQHPGGLEKHIALYHNVVRFTDDSRVQYLTDTMPGSSGSPVFDSTWQVVALHHSRGWVLDKDTGKRGLRNEGIHVRVLRAGLKARGFLKD